MLEAVCRKIPIFSQLLPCFKQDEILVHLHQNFSKLTILVTPVQPNCQQHASALCWCTSGIHRIFKWYLNPARVRACAFMWEHVSPWLATLIVLDVWVLRMTMHNLEMTSGTFSATLLVRVGITRQNFSPPPTPNASQWILLCNFSFENYFLAYCIFL